MVLQNPLSGIDSLTHRGVVGPNPIDLNWILEVDWHTHWFHCILACGPWPMQRIAKREAVHFNSMSCQQDGGRISLTCYIQREIFPVWSYFWMRGCLAETRFIKSSVMSGEKKEWEKEEQDERVWEVVALCQGLLLIFKPLWNWDRWPCSASSAPRSILSHYFRPTCFDAPQLK